MTDPNIEGDVNNEFGDAGFRTMSPLIFRVETKWNTSKQSGTGFCVAKLHAENRLILATARHVLDFPPNATVRWNVQQFDESGSLKRQLTFETIGADPDSPYMTHKMIDLGLVALPEIGDNSKPFATEEEYPLRTIDCMRRLTTGTRVAWAGYAGIVEQVAEVPTLCYFEGVISATIDQFDKRLYVVDGHNARGVSGGPVWHFNDEKKRYEVVGVVSRYKMHHDAMPGFAIFEPVNPIMVFLRTPETRWSREVVINNYG